VSTFLPQEPACFVSTHLDDVGLSCSCYLLEHPGTSVVTILAGAPEVRREDGWNAWTTGKTFAPDAVGVRRHEDAAAMRKLKARPTWLEFWGRQYLDGKDEDEHVIARALADVIASLGAASLVGPLGLQHPDHLAVSNACFKVARTSAIHLYLYLDMPYAQKYPGATEERLAALLDRGLTLEPLDPVAANKRAKKRVVRHYKSQCGKMHYTKLEDVMSAPEQYWRVVAG
jgi:LmbE family N-acetylglucosaminyl deacetylase